MYVLPMRGATRHTFEDSSTDALISLQFWLLGYEFPTTLMLFTLDTLYILTTQKKGLLPFPLARCLARSTDTLLQQST